MIKINDILKEAVQKDECIDVEGHELNHPDILYVEDLLPDWEDIYNSALEGEDEE